MILGTANFGNEYKGVLIGKDQAFDILDAAWAYGIRMLDTGRAYGDSEEIIAEYALKRSRYFKVFTKVKTAEEHEVSRDTLGPLLYGCLWHWGGDATKMPPDLDGVSCYGDEWQQFHNAGQVSDRLSYLQVPWNILDRRHEATIRSLNAHEVNVILRSIFIRGHAFTLKPIAGLPFWMWCLQNIPECYDFIVGVDSVDQLSDIVKAPRKIRLVYADPMDWVAE